MLSSRLNVQLRLGQLQVQPARLDLTIQSTPAIQGSQIQVSKSSFEVTSAKSPKLEVSTRAIQNELGFKRPREFAKQGSLQAKTEAESAVSRITSEGYQYLNNPQDATVGIAKNVGVYKPSVQLAAIPKNRPSINVGEPGKVVVNLQKGEVAVSDISSFSIDADYIPTRASLDNPPRVEIKVVPVNPPRLNLDVRA